jgi:hypothetical protein
MYDTKFHTHTKHHSLYTSIFVVWKLIGPVRFSGLKIMSPNVTDKSGNSFGIQHIGMYEGVSKSLRTESITKYTLATINTRSEATQRVMAAKLTRLTYKIAIQLHLVVESCTICSSCARRPVRELLDTLSYIAYICMCVFIAHGLNVNYNCNDFL